MNKPYDISVYKKGIGANIVKYRKAKHFSQRELSKIVGIAPQTLSGIETGINNCSFNVMIKIALALEIPLSYIFTFDETVYDVSDKELLFLASEAFKDLSYENRQIAFKLIQCFKEEKS
jgi:transcriptional regulator with XRE-family HTH domain